MYPDIYIGDWLKADRSMATNFFEQQDTARKKSGRLVLLFVAAVAVIIVLVYLVALMATGFLGTDDPQAGAPPYLGLFLLTAFGVTGVVASCSVYKVIALRSGGGESVARSMGGRLLQPDAADAFERKILNVVEEMALASGIAVPPVYLMDHESGINAFAAGYSPDNAVIGITRGAVEQLTRDELQGVVAHEFSHILNGDMRLNIRLMGVLFGILAIAVIGRMLMHIGFASGSSYRSRRSNRDNSGAIWFGLAGLAIMAIGFVGVFFGRVIQASVSRQREFLADASAVQFTRNPDSIGGALKRIGGFSSFVGSGHADEASHMFIATSTRMWANGAFATHPPIEERIKRIDPSWDGSYPEPKESKKKRPRDEPKRQQARPPFMGEDSPFGGILGAAAAASMTEPTRTPNRPRSSGGPVSSRRTSSQSAMDDIGAPSADHVAYMRELLASIPAVFKQAAREPYGARAVVYMLLLDNEPAVQAKQFEQLTRVADAKVVELTRGFAKLSSDLPKQARLPLIDLAVLALRELSDKQYAAFKANVAALVKADGRVDLFEWSMQRLLLRHLDGHFNPAPDPKVRHYNLKPVALQCSTLLSVLAHVGNRDEAAAAKAFDAGRQAIGVTGLAMMSRKQVRLDAVGQALDELAHVSPREKKKLIEACARVIAEDGNVTRGEGELMRAVADSLGVPMPPLLPGQKLL